APVTVNNIGTVRKLNSVIFPVRYAERFYKTILNPDLEEFCKLIYFNDIPVGTTCSRIETGSAADSKAGSTLYMMTLGILAPYRNYSAGTMALKEIIEAASTYSYPSSQPPSVERIQLHVQTNNVDARRFYEKHGFKVVKQVEGYYKKIEPKSAWLLERDV
ncbi:N-acetyltransferase NAT13, partial [Cantharellus anzutake]|uniref:N-acetyltransferase NAT13 n=1 Tax=Cantharellus anzutake TaxID=1750568 RepID=UPI001906D2E1